MAGHPVIRLSYAVVHFSVTDFRCQITTDLSGNDTRVQRTVDGRVCKLASMLDHAVTKNTFRLRVQCLVISLTTQSRHWLHGIHLCSTCCFTNKPVACFHDWIFSQRSPEVFLIKWSNGLQCVLVSVYTRIRSVEHGICPTATRYSSQVAP